MPIKQKNPLLPRNLALMTFGKSPIVFSTKVNLLYLLYSAESCKPHESKGFVRCWNKIGKKYSQEQQPVSLLQPEHGFCQQNKLERGQVLVSK